MYEFVYVCMYVCIHVPMYVCMHLCVHMSTYMYWDMKGCIGFRAQCLHLGLQGVTMYCRA